VPITPFHFGPGALVHAVAPRRVSFIAFVAANCITDVESIYNILRNTPPLHRFLHTFAGATLVAVLTTALFLLMRLWSRKVTLPNWFQWQQLGLSAVLLGAAIGSYSHILLDGIMHSDMRPFAPWSDANPFLRAIPLSTLHWICIISGVAGVAIWLKTRPNPQQ
jgi:membrane-bound metal-dependent hydrolase YbcI (DUF457 family)